MKKIVMSLAVVGCMFPAFSIDGFRDQNNTTMPVPTSNIDGRISKNFQKIDALTAKINVIIVSIEGTHKEIEDLKKNKNKRVICNALTSLYGDIIELEELLKDVKDSVKKEEYKESLDELNGIYNKEKEKEKQCS